LYSGPNYLEKLPVTGYEPTNELARLQAPAEGQVHHHEECTLVNERHMYSYPYRHWSFQIIPQLLIGPLEDKGMTWNKPIFLQL